MTGNETRKAYEENLEIINQELLILEDCCIRRGYTPLEVQKSAHLFLRDVKSVEKQHTKKILLKLAIFVGLCAALAYYDPAYRFVVAVSRASSIKVLKVWDWTWIYELECMIRNPLQDQEEEDWKVATSPEDCEVCKAIRKISVHRNISTEIMGNTYIKFDIPVMVVDGTRDWSDPGQFNIEFLAQLFNEHSVLRMYMGCQFDSNVATEHGDHRPFLRQVAEGEITNYYAQWQTCFKEPAKTLREFFKRPYCLPPVVELADLSWLLISNNYQPPKDKAAYMPVLQDSPLVMMVQLTGEITVKLLPRNVCADSCKVLKATLRKGQILIASDYFYDITYKPSSKPDSDSVTFVVSGSFDN